MDPRLLATASLLLLPLAHAHGGWAHCGLSETLIDANNDGYPEAYLTFSGGWIYLYAESNGMDHLQRGYAADVCQEDENPDYALVIF